MTTLQFTRALVRLDLTSSSAARVLGITIRQVQRLSSGKQNVPRQTALLINMYLKHGIPQDHQQ